MDPLTRQHDHEGRLRRQELRVLEANSTVYLDLPQALFPVAGAGAAPTGSATLLIGDGAMPTFAGGAWTLPSGTWLATLSAVVATATRLFMYADVDTGAGFPAYQFETDIPVVTTGSFQAGGLLGGFGQLVGLPFVSDGSLLLWVDGSVDADSTLLFERFG